eukprot:scaffold4496_cov134-Amphora_coffeaeformis.AAC.1
MPRVFPLDNNVTKEARSAMVQSWNKFCFTGGIVEFSAQLPGNPYTGGLWPALWMMGNLARATYVNSTEHMWPFSAGHVCDDRNRVSQEINACRHDSSTSDADAAAAVVGRGAPEIDMLEVMYISQINASMLSASLQVAPGLAQGRPNLGMEPNKTWYQPVLGEGATLNEYFYGVHVEHRSNDGKLDYEFQTDTISINYWLDDSFWTRQHLFRVEWEPPLNDGSGGYIHWYIDGNLMAGIEGEELQRVSQTEIPSEPMSLLMNLAVSKDWSFPDAWFLNCKHKCWSCFDPKCQCALPEGFCESLPVHFLIDYVRVYQAAHNPRHTLGCSPPSRPTVGFIEAHKERYMVHGQTEPLLPVTTGGASCVVNDDCGHGTCVVGRPPLCHCRNGWTGPTCLAHNGSDNTAFDVRRATATFLAFLALFLMFGSFLSFVGYKIRNRNYSTRVLYELLSDIESEKVLPSKGAVIEGSEPPALKPMEQGGGSSLSYQTE